jgi:hypothetical protein
MLLVLLVLKLLLLQDACSRHGDCARRSELSFEHG